MTMRTMDMELTFFEQYFKKQNVQNEKRNSLSQGASKDVNHTLKIIVN